MNIEKMTLSMMVMLFCFGATRMYAFPSMERQFVERHGLSEEQIGEISEIYYEMRTRENELNGFIEQHRQDIAQLLLAIEPDMDYIRESMFEEIHFEVEARFNRIAAEVAVRKIIGDDVWSDIIRHRDQEKNYSWWDKWRNGIRRGDLQSDHPRRRDSRWLSWDKD